MLQRRGLLLLAGLLAVSVLIALLLTDRDPVKQVPPPDPQMHAQALEETESHAAPEAETVPKASLRDNSKPKTAGKQALTKPRKPEPTSAAPSTTITGNQVPAKSQAKPVLITFGRCTTKPGYLMANDEQTISKAALLQGKSDAAGRAELRTAGLVQDLPARIEIILYGVNLDNRLAKILIPGQEIIFWTSYEALECNL